MIEVGTYTVDITPPVGIPLVGFANRDVSTGVLDSLTATALVAASGGERVAFIDCDLLYVSEATTARVRGYTTQQTGIPGSHVAVMGTHTHFGPDVCWNVESPVCAAYLSNLEYLLAGAVHMAAGRLQPVRMGIGWGESDIGINRRERLPDGRIVLGRNPAGPIDRSVGVCRIDSTSGTPVATIVGFQAHPVSLTGAWREVSADFPGVLRGLVGRLTGAPCLYVQGACGDINPERMGPDPDIPRSLGTRLGCAAMDVWETVQPLDADGVAAGVHARDLPRYLRASREEALDKLGELKETRTRLESEDALEGMLDWMDRRIRRLRRSVAAWDGDEEVGVIEAEFQALRMGPLSIATAPGEIFNELGVQVKSSGERGGTFFASNTNGAVGYVPTKDAYGRGGYEVDDACKVGPEAGEMLVDECTRLIEEVDADA